MNRMIVWQEPGGDICGLNPDRVINWRFQPSAPGHDEPFLEVWTAIDTGASPLEYWGWIAEAIALRLQAGAGIMRRKEVQADA